MSQSGKVAGRLHVLTITPFFPSNQNEVNGCFIAEPIEQLQQFGVDSTVIAVAPMYYPRQEPSATSTAEWVRYPQVPGNLGLATAGKLLYTRLLQRVRNLHRARPIDVIHAHAALPCGHASALLSKRLNIPFVVTLHGLDVFNTCFLGGIPAAWRRRVSMDVYRSAHTVVCISGKVQEVLQSGMPMQMQIRSTIVHNGVNPTLFSPDPLACRGSAPAKIEAAVGPFDARILMVGNLQRSKGHELVLRTLATLKPSFPHLHCRIIGEGPDRTRFEDLARELVISQQVEFVGRQSRAGVADAMRH
ncbi:MAG: glycosyltransferase, partial [Terriglobales bacterium]